MWMVMTRVRGRLRSCWALRGQYCSNLRVTRASGNPHNCCEPAFMSSNDGGSILGMVEHSDEGVEHRRVLCNGALALTVSCLGSRMDAEGAVGFTNMSSKRRGTSKHNWTGGGGERGPHSVHYLRGRGCGYEQPQTTMLVTSRRRDVPSSYYELRAGTSSGYMLPALLEGERGTIGRLLTFRHCP
jgi:hypothetical protein